MKYPFDTLEVQVLYVSPNLLLIASFVLIFTRFAHHRAWLYLSLVVSKF